MVLFRACSGANYSNGMTIRNASDESALLMGLAGGAPPLPQGPAPSKRGQRPAVEQLPHVAQLPLSPAATPPCIIRPAPAPTITIISP